jgi:plastocyanin
MFRFRTQVAFISLVGALAACGSSYGSSTAPPPPPPPGNTIDATPSEVFTPATLNVAVGQTVTFSFGSLAHNVFFATQAGAPADITGLNANVSIDRQFTTQGTYNYTCHIHPQMHGTVVVQ